MPTKPKRKPLVPINEQVFNRCGATSKRHGGACVQPAMSNGRCRFHGGKSTGPKTEEGRQKISQAHYKHGLYTNDAMAERRYFSQLVQEWRESLKYGL